MRWNRSLLAQQLDLLVLDDAGSTIYQVFLTDSERASLGTEVPTQKQVPEETEPASSSGNGKFGSGGNGNGGSNNGSSGNGGGNLGGVHGASSWRVTDSVEAVYQGDVVKTSYRHPRFGDDYWLVAAPIYQTETTHIIGAVVLSASLVPVAEAAAILKQQLVYIMAIMLVASLVVSWVISRHFSRPLGAISEAAQSHRKGRLSSPCVETTLKDEIGQLAADINFMGENLERTEALRRELIGNVSHELRTPLSLIRGYAETLRDLTGWTA